MNGFTKRKTWTEDEDKQLVELLTREGERLSCRAIGRLIDRGSSSVLARAAKLGYKNLGQRGRLRKYPQTMVDEMRRMRSAGHSYAEIGRTLGVKHGYVKHLCHHAGIGIGVEVWQPDNDTLLIELIKRGKTRKEVAMTLQQPMPTIRSELARIFPGEKPEYIHEFLTRGKDCRAAMMKDKVRAARSRSERKGMAFELSVEEVTRQLDRQEGRCWYTGDVIEFRSYSGRCFSLDRLDSSIGYTTANTVICTWNANRMKQDMSIKEYVETCAKVAQRAAMIDTTRSSETVGRWNETV